MPTFKTSRKLYKKYAFLGGYCEFQKFILKKFLLLSPSSLPYSYCHWQLFHNDRVIIFAGTPIFLRSISPYRVPFTRLLLLLFPIKNLHFPKTAFSTVFRSFPFLRTCDMGLLYLAVPLVFFTVRYYLGKSMVDNIIGLLLLNCVTYSLYRSFGRRYLSKNLS